MEPGIVYPLSGEMVGPSITILLNENTNRRGVIISNTDKAIYVAPGPYVSPALFTYYMRPYSTVEIPDFRGIISAVAAQLTYVSITEVI